MEIQLVAVFPDRPGDVGLGTVVAGAAGRAKGGEDLAVEAQVVDRGSDQARRDSPPDRVANDNIIVFAQVRQVVFDWDPAVVFLLLLDGGPGRLIVPIKVFGRVGFNRVNCGEVGVKLVSDRLCSSLGGSSGGVVEYNRF